MTPQEITDLHTVRDRLFAARTVAALGDLLAMVPAPALVWLQVGICNDRFAAEVTEAGIDLVQGRCTLAAHRAWS